MNLMYGDLGLVLCDDGLLMGLDVFLSWVDCHSKAVNYMELKIHNKQL